MTDDSPKLDRSTVTSQAVGADSTSKRSKSPSSPQLKIDPTSESADHTVSTFNSTDPTATTPGYNLPGGYPETPSTQEPGPSFEEMKDTAKEYFRAAGQYVPSQEELRRMAQTAGANVRGYIPIGIATYGGPLQPTQEPVTASPLEESETTPTTGEAFVLINRGNHNETTGARGNHEVQHEFVTGPSDRAEHRTFTGIHRAPDLLKAGANSEKADSDASTRTQRGSYARVKENGSTAGDVATPFSIPVGNPTTPGRSEFQFKTPPVVGSTPQQFQGQKRDIHPEPHGGVVTHGGGPMASISDEKHCVSSTSDKIGVSQPAARLLAGETVRSQGKEGGANDSDRYRPQRLGNRPNGTTAPMSQNPERSLPTNSRMLEQERHKDHNAVNTSPRTHPLGKKESQWKGVLLEEEHQSGLDTNGSRGQTIRENGESRITSGTSFGEDKGSPSMKPQMNKVASSTATTGHDEDTAATPLMDSRFAEPLSSCPEEHPEHNGQTIEHARKRSSDSPLGDQHPSAETAPETTENAVGRRRGRKGGFLNKLKGWSKRLSQDKKAYN